MNVTLFKRGTKETTLPIRDVKIPDVWKALEALVDVINHDDPRHDAILVTWHTAHSLKERLQEIEKIVDRYHAGNLTAAQVLESFELT
jgi:hypothetical protein